jgi:transposase
VSIKKEAEIKKKTKMVVRMYLDGLNAPQIAIQTEISKSTIYRYLKSVGINPSILFLKRKRNRIGLFTPIQDKEIARLYQKVQLSLNKLAEKFGCSTGAIKNALKREKVKINPKGNRHREFSIKEIEDIVDRYQNKKQAQTYIAQKHNSHQVTIGRILRKQGIKPKRRRSRMEKHGNWKGGRITTSSGYVYVLLPRNHRFASMCQKSGYVAEHRLIMAKHLGRPLKKHETVHHKNGIKTYNKIENFELRQGKHGNGVVVECGDCGSQNIISV